jgi:hypothetical protein
MNGWSRQPHSILRSVDTNFLKLRKLNSVALVRELTIPTSDRRLSAKLMPTFADPYGRILGFLDRSHYYFFLVASQLYSGG